MQTKILFPIQLCYNASLLSVIMLSVVMLNIIAPRVVFVSLMKYTSFFRIMYLNWALLFWLSLCWISQCWVDQYVFKVCPGWGANLGSICLISISITCTTELQQLLTVCHNVECRYAECHSARRCFCLTDEIYLLLQNFSPIERHDGMTKQKNSLQFSRIKIFFCF